LSTGSHLQLPTVRIYLKSIKSNRKNIMNREEDKYFEENGRWGSQLEEWDEEPQD